MFFKAIPSLSFAALVTVFSASAAVAQDFFTRDELLSVSPRAQPQLVDALVANQALLAQNGINSRLRLAHFLSQVFLETGGLRVIDENMNYSAGRLREVFGRRVPVAKAQALAAITPREEKERQIANWVYGNRLGNQGRNTDDGWNYRGSGYIQLTGRANFRARGDEIGIDLESDPEKARSPVDGLKAATAYWKARNINAPADINDRYYVRVLVNGPAAHDFEKGVAWFNKIWVKIFRDKAPINPEPSWLESDDIGIDVDAETLGAGAILRVEGFLEPVNIESTLPQDIDAAEAAALTEAVRSFQASRGLEVTGEIDDDTFYALTEPSKDQDQTKLAMLPGNPDGTSRHLLGGIPVIEDVPVFDPVETVTGATSDQLSIEDRQLVKASASYSDMDLEFGKFTETGVYIPFTVIGDDSRKAILNTKEFPASAIVQITYKKPGRSGRYQCSGAMIAENLVLTAGHCVHSGTRGGQWFQKFFVFPGRNTLNRPFGRCKATEVFALSGWTESQSAFEASSYDMGAIRLDCSVGERTGIFGLRALGGNERGIATTVQGYAPDKQPQGRQWFSLDQMRKIHKFKGFYQNDTVGGTSGAPVFSGTDYRIFCVHANGVSPGLLPPWNANNACTRMTDTRLRTIASWIDG